MQAYAACLSIIAHEQIPCMLCWCVPAVSALFVYTEVESASMRPFLQERGPFSELQTALVLYECLKVIASCHVSLHASILGLVTVLIKS